MHKVMLNNKADIDNEIARVDNMLLEKSERLNELGDEYSQEHHTLTQEVKELRLDLNALHDMLLSPLADD